MIERNEIFKLTNEIEQLKEIINRLQRQVEICNTEIKILKEGGNI